MTIIYSAPKKIVIDGVVIEFNEKREAIRSELGKGYVEDNQVIPIGESDTDVIYQREDINIDTLPNLTISSLASILKVEDIGLNLKYFNIRVYWQICENNSYKIVSYRSEYEKIKPNIIIKEGPEIKIK